MTSIMRSWLRTYSCCFRRRFVSGRRDRYRPTLTAQCGGQARTGPRTILWLLGCGGSFRRENLQPSENNHCPYMHPGGPGAAGYIYAFYHHLVNSVAHLSALPGDGKMGEYVISLQVLALNALYSSVTEWITVAHHRLSR